MLNFIVCSEDVIVFVAGSTILREGACWTIVISFVSEEPMSVIVNVVLLLSFVSFGSTLIMNDVFSLPSLYGRCTQFALSPAFQFAELIVTSLLPPVAPKERKVGSTVNSVCPKALVTTNVSMASKHRRSLLIVFISI